MNFKQSISIGTSIVLLTSSLYSDSWSSTQNQHGFILKSDDTTLYLGKSCDATSPQYGTGEWYWSDSEIIVSLSNKDISFNSGSLYEDGRCKKGSTQSSQESLPALSYHWIYDENGCKHYNPKPVENETLTWSGSCKNGYGAGYGTTVWYKNGIKGKSFNETKNKGKVEKKDNSNDEAALVGAAIGIAAIGWLFGVGRDTSSSSSSSDYSSSSSSSSSIDYIQIEADCIHGLLPCIEKNLQVTGGTGRFEPSFNKASSGTIYKDYQGNTEGTYNFSVKFDDNLCTGSFYVSGQKKHYTIALGKDCLDNGSREW